MLQSIRNRAQGWIAKILVTLIILTFAFWGIESLVPSKDQRTVVSVNKEKITQQDLLRAMERRRNYLMQEQGENFNSALLDEGLLQRVTLNELVNNALIKSKVEDLNLNFSSDQLNYTIVNTPEFQSDGAFDSKKFDQLLMSLGLTFEQFKTFLSQDMKNMQLRNAISASNFTTVNEMNKLETLYNQTRKIALIELDSEAITKDITVTDEQIKQYYEDNKEQFKSTEQVKVNYLLLDREKIKNSVEVTDKEIEELYQTRIAEIKNQTNRSSKISVIIFDHEKDGKTAVQRAENVYQLLNDGGDFASLAKQYSDDQETAVNGGLIGAIETGFFGDTFDKAVARLEDNSYSQPIETDFGTVIIEKKQPDTFTPPTLVSMRSDLIEEIKENAASVVYMSNLQKLADISYEAIDLEHPMEALKLELKTTDYFSRKGGNGITANPKFIAMAFSDDVLTADLNSELIEISDEQAAVLHLNDYKPAIAIPLASVKNDIKKTLEEEAISNLQRTESEKIIASLKAGQSLETIKASFPLKWQSQVTISRNNTQQDQALITRVFKMPKPSADSPVFATQRMSNGNLAIVKLEAVEIGKSLLTAQQKKQLTQSITMSTAETLFSEMIEYWKNNASIKYYLNESS